MNVPVRLLHTILELIDAFVNVRPSGYTWSSLAQGTHKSIPGTIHTITYLTIHITNYSLWYYN